jgi:dTDP-4-dehydrorhamnose reductase
LIYVSTDYVFDGRRGGYRETDYPSPGNWYGLTKLAGELAAATCLPGADLAIVRTTFYGLRVDGRGFFNRCLATLTAGQGLDAAVDLISSPLPVTVLARALTELAGKRLGGIHHIAGAQRCSRYEFALAVARVHGLDASLVRPESRGAASLPGPRPRDVSLCVCRAQERLRVPLPTLVKGLEELSVDGSVIMEGLGDGSR